MIMNENNAIVTAEQSATDIVPSEKALAEALDTADKMVRMQYLAELDNMEIIPLSDKEKRIAPESKVRLYHMACLTYDENESISDKLSGVFNSIAGYDATAVFILKHDGSKTDLYMGTACDDPQKVQLASRTFSRALSGNFPGCISESTTEEQVKELLDNVMDYDHEDSLAIASISSIASTRGEGASYLQGMEKLVDGMNGIPFNLVVLASALSHKTISAIKNGYESLYTQLTPFHKLSASMSDTDTQSFSRSIGESLSQTMTTSEGSTDSTTDTTGMTRTLTRTKQDEKTKKDKAVDIFAAAANVAGAVGGAVLGGGDFIFASVGGSIGGAIGKAAQTMIQSPTASTSEGSSENKGISISKGTNYSESKAEGKTDTTTDTMGDTHSTGKTMQYSMENRSVGSLLSAIDVHINRLTACEGNGAFQCAAYLMAADQATARMGASLYRSLLTGSSPEASVSYVNVWQEHKDTALLCEYFKHMKHPRFSVGNELLGDVTATTTASSQDLPLHFAWPRKSLPGLMVTSHAEFSRDIIKTDDNDTGVVIGNITHNAIAEMRTYGEGFIIADQTPSIMSEAVISNTGSKVIFRLPNIKDRTPVSEAVSLNASQIEEIARLNTGVAVVHQSGWLNPVLCKIDLFPTEDFCPLDYTPDEVPKEFLLKARGVFLELLLCKRMNVEAPTKQFCMDAMDVLSLSRDKNDKKISQYIKDYLATGKMTAWDSFDEMCKIARTLFGADKLFNPFPNNAADWNIKAYEYVKTYANTNESTISDFLAVLIISRNTVSPQAKSFYFKWLADKE